MKRRFSGVIALFGILFMLAAAAVTAGAAGRSGEVLFKQHCAACHPDGGNIMNPHKTLHKKDLKANNIKSTADIVKIMRNPGPGMLTFDAKTIPDKDAKEIAEYILGNFGKK